MQFTSHEAESSDAALMSATSVDTVISPLDIFIANVERVSEELQPLVEWTCNFKGAAAADDIRNVIHMCQVRCIRRFLVNLIVA